MVSKLPTSLSAKSKLQDMANIFGEVKMRLRACRELSEKLLTMLMEPSLASAAVKELNATTSSPVTFKLPLTPMVQHYLSMVQHYATH